MAESFIWPIVEKVAAEYGVNPNSLEAGDFDAVEIGKLYRLYDSYLSSPTPEKFEAYVRQKAKFKFGK